MRALRKRYPWLADEFLKKRSVMNHDLAQVFGAGLPLRAAKRALVGGAIVLENLWMIYGDIHPALFNALDRVAARGQDVAQELVGIGHRSARAVNEARLHSAPGLEKSHTVAGSEWEDVQGHRSSRSFFSFQSFGGQRFHLPQAQVFVHGPRIYAAALSVEFSRAAFTRRKVNDDGYDDQEYDGDADGHFRRGDRR